MMERLLYQLALLSLTHMFNHCNKKAMKNLINQEKDIEAKYLDVWM